MVIFIRHCSQFIFIRHCSQLHVDVDVVAAAAILLLRVVSHPENRVAQHHGDDVNGVLFLPFSDDSWMKSSVGF